MNKEFQSLLKLNLAQKYGFVFSLIIFFVVISLTFINILSQEKILKDRLFDEATSVITVLESALAEELFSLQINEVRQHLQHVRANPEVIYTFVYDEYGRIISDGTNRDLFRHQILNDTLTKNALESENLFLQVEDDILDISMPIKLSMNKLGTIRIGYSLESLNTEIRDLRNKNLLLGFIYFIIGFIISAIIISRILKPVKLLKEATKKVAEGDLNYTVNIKTGDELEDLSNSFNSMVKKIKSTREEIIESKEEAEKSNRLKSEFLAQMSHEIRTPVNTILNFSSLIKYELGKNIDSLIKDCFTSIELGGKRLIRTIDLILNMSEIQANSYKASFDQITLNSDVLNPLIDEFKYVAAAKNLYLNFESKINDDKLTGDNYTLTQLFNNLIDNALKYTHKGGVDIRLYRNGSNQIVVSVKDTGIGISNEYKKVMFQPFTQEEQGYTRKFEGTGLGLALVKKYCELNGADIQLFSEKGNGSEFVITFSKEPTIVNENSSEKFYNKTELSPKEKIS